MPKWKKETEHCHKNNNPSVQQDLGVPCGYPLRKSKCSATIDNLRHSANKKHHLIFLVLLLAVSAFWAWRVQYGGADIYSDSDESFYASIPYRMLFGDMLLYDEINTTQLVAFLLFPLVKAWNLVTGGNTEGIILTFRYIWLVWHLAVSVAIYLLGCKRGYRLATCSALVYGISAPYVLTVLSYNTIALSAVTLLVLLYYLKYDSVAANIAKGFLLAMIVLCNPYAILLYVSILILAIVNKFTPLDEQLNAKSLGAFHLGIMLLLLPFIMYVGLNLQKRGLSPADLLKNIGYMVSMDSFHDTGGTLYSFAQHKLQFALQFMRRFRLYIPLFLAILIIGCTNSKMKKYRIAAVMVLNAVYCVYALIISRSHLVLTFGGLLGIALCVFKWDIIRKHSITAWILAFLFVVAVNLCSNTMLFGVSWACSVLHVLSYLIIEDISSGEDSENPEILRRKKFICSAAFCVIILAIVGIDIKLVYGDASIPELTAQISEGPAKGIYTTPEKQELYTAVSQELKSVPLNNEDNVLIIPTIPIDLFTLQREVCSPSTWLFVSDYLNLQLMDYYQKHPDKIPTVVMIHKAVLNRDNNEKMKAMEMLPLLTENGYTLEQDDDVFAVLRSNGQNLWTK